jgi:hypothetical protein
VVLSSNDIGENKKRGNSDPMQTIKRNEPTRAVIYALACAILDCILGKVNKDAGNT